MLEGIFTAAGVLILVIVILYLTFMCTKFIAKGTRIKGHSRYLKMVDQLPVGQDRSVAVVQIGGQYFLIGVAASEISILAELDEEALVPVGDPDNTDIAVPDFKELMDKFRNRKN